MTVTQTVSECQGERADPACAARSCGDLQQQLGHGNTHLGRWRPLGMRSAISFAFALPFTPYSWCEGCAANSS
jgi:hypothetical protein